MKDQINTIREALDALTTTSTSDEVLRMKWYAKAKLSELERMAGEPVAWKHDCAALLTNDVELWVDNCPHCGKPRATPPAQQPQYEAADMASASAQGFRDGVASVTQQEPVAWRVHPFDYGIGHEGVYATTHLTQQRDAWLRKGWNVESLYTAAPVAQQHETVTNDEQASAYMDARLWEFIDMAGMWPRAKPDPRIWAHVMVYAPVAQQPPEIEVQCPVCSHTFYEWPKAQQPQAEAVPSDVVRDASPVYVALKIEGPRFKCARVYGRIYEVLAVGCDKKALTAVAKTAEAAYYDLYYGERTLPKAAYEWVVEQVPTVETALAAQGEKP